MRLFRLLWLLHRWLGITFGVVLLLSAVTGFLLLRKKHHDWLQPPMMTAAAGTPDTYQPLAKVYAAVFALGLPEFRDEGDIARIDFRPAQRVHKVTSRHGDVEVQVCAVTLRTQGPAVRRSDWLERLHDGSAFGDLAHGWLFPAVAVVLLFLALSGYVMWGWPKLLRWRRGGISPRA
ncbi:MAG: PepSY domain-containing protein [Planctomycetes bacterium]|nr:PepSY domain-containing protein [Planctomycetota bacterium]